jgi:hypothetical protein
MKSIKIRFDKLTQYHSMEELSEFVRKKLINKLYRPLYNNIDMSISMLKRRGLNEAN